MLLRVDGISAGYGGGTVVHRIDLTVPAGSVHAIVGHNGAGKSTLLHTIAGLIKPGAGKMLLDGKDVTRLPAHRRARAGVGYVPQGARVFASLTVAEHLSLGRKGDWTRQRILDLLPRLGERLRHRGAQLSGGEKQMLAIARALQTQPRLLLLDEPTEGLAPVVIDQIRAAIKVLAGDGLGILVATPQPDLALAVAGTMTVLTAGRITADLKAGTAPQVLYAELTPSATPAQRAA